MAIQPVPPRLGLLGRWLVPNMASGLTLFFVLSGFLLYRPFAAAILSGSELPLGRAYLRNRALRIMPAYVVILLIVALVLGAAVQTSTFYTQLDFRAVGPLHAPGLLLQNLALVQGFTPTSLLTGIGPAWSLGVELVFYLLLPVLASAAARRADRLGSDQRLAAALAPAGLLLVVGVVSKALAAATSHSLADQWGATWHAVFERSFLPSADLFSFGMAAAVIVLATDQGRLRRINASFVGIATLLTGLVFVGLHSEDVMGSRAFTTAMGLTFGLLVLHVTLPASATPRRLASLLETRGMVSVGIISYSVYLWHQPLIFYLRQHGMLASNSLSSASNVVLVLAVSLAAAAITYRFVEAPAMRHKRAITRRPQTAAYEMLGPETAEAAP